jgi:hypothetical protein
MTSVDDLRSVNPNSDLHYIGVSRSLGIPTNTPSSLVLAVV